MSKHAVVIGAGQGGLSAAIRLRLYGFDVTVLEQHDSVGGKAGQIVQDGFRLDPGPSIIILPEIYQAVFRAAGKNPDDYLRFQRLDPITRVYMEGEAAIDFPSDRESAIAALRNLSPGDAESLEGIFQVLDKNWDKVQRSVFSRPFEHWFQLLNPDLMAFGLAFDVRKPYREFIDQKFSTPLMRAFFYGFPSYSGQTYNKPAPGALTIPYLMLTNGVWWPVGGIGAIPAAFARLATDLGVKFVTSHRVTSMVQSGNRIVAVKTEHGDEIAADVVVSNLDRLATEQMLGRTVTSKPSFSYFTIHWGLSSGSDVSVEFAHHTLLIPREFAGGFEHLYRDRKFPSPPIVYLNETAGTDPSTAPTGGKNLFAVITVPAEEADIDWVNPSPYIDSTLAVMRRFGVEIKDAVFQRVQTPITFRQRDGNYRGTLYGVDESERILGGMFPLTNRDRIGNLFYSGGSVQPGAGLPMVTISGQFAANLARKLL